MKRRNKNKLMPVIMTLILLLSMIVLPQSVLAVPPTFSNEIPVDGTIDIPISTSSLSIDIANCANWSITTTPNVGSDSGTGSGPHTCAITNLIAGIAYSWTVTADNGSSPVSATYTFRTKPSGIIDKVSKTDNLTCGEAIWVNASGLISNDLYTVKIDKNISGGVFEWETIEDNRADDDGEVSIKLNVPYRNSLGEYNLGLLDKSGGQVGINETIWINNTFEVIYKVGNDFLEHALYNYTYEYPETPFYIYIYNWTGLKYELYEESVDIDLKLPDEKLDLEKTTSMGMWYIDYTFDSKVDSPNLETYYWVWINDTIDTNEYSRAKLPVKLDVTAQLPSDMDWGETATISGYVKDGNGDGIGDYTVKLYSPSESGYIEMDSANTFSSGRYSLERVTDDGSAGTWHVGTLETGSYRIDETDKINITDFIAYHSFDVASDDSAKVRIVSPDEIVSGFNQTINVSVYNSWDDKYYEEMWIHVTGVDSWNYTTKTEYDDEDIIVITNDSKSSTEKYAYYEFNIKFNETGTGTIFVTHPNNNSVYEDIDLEANITGSTTFTVVSPDEMTIIVENMPDKVEMDLDADGDHPPEDCDWINTSTDITILIYGEEQDNRMNAEIEITGCGVDIEIDEDEAVADGKYIVPISPKHKGTLTITVTNDTENISYSKDYSIGGLSGSVTTSKGDDLEIPVQSTETITVDIPIGGQYAEVHLTWFDENWDIANNICINDTGGDNTAGNGLNGVYNFIITEEDIEDGVGYIVVAVLAGSEMYLYDVVEVAPIHDMVIDIIDPVDAANQTLTIGLEHAWEFKVLDGDGDLITDIDEVTAEILDNEGDIIQTESLSVKSGDIWYLDDWIPHFAGDLVITAVNNSGENEHDGNITLDVEKAEVTYSPNKVTCGIGLKNITVDITVIDANGHPPPDGTKLYINIHDASDAETDPDDYIVLDEDGMGEFTIEIVGDEKGKINGTFQGAYTDYAGNTTDGELKIVFPTFIVEPSEIYINMANTVIITALDSNNDPIKGINITLVASSAGIISASPDPVETSTEGKVSLSISPVASGNLNVTIAREIKYVGGRLTWDINKSVITNTTIKVTAKRSLDISVSKSPIYEGEILTVTIRSGGVPVSGVDVEFGQVTSQTGSNGEATFTVPDPGVESAIYTITAKKTGYITEEKAISVIKRYAISIVGPSADPQTGSSFTISVLAKGSGLAGASVTLEGTTKTSDNNGKVTFTAPSDDGDYVITATYENYKEGTLTITVIPGGIPGFELLTLIAAIGVAFILLRRRRH